MAYLEIPVISDIPSYTFNLVLEGTKFNFNFRFNKRLDRWTFDLSDSENILIIAGIPLLTNLLLTERYSYDNLPKGEFFVLDMTGNEANPSEIGLGDDYKLIYRESTTVDE